MKRKMCLNCRKEVAHFKRKDALFCSPVCKNAFWQKKYRSKKILKNSLRYGEKYSEKDNKAVVIMVNKDE